MEKKMLSYLSTKGRRKDSVQALYIIKNSVELSTINRNDGTNVFYYYSGPEDSSNRNFCKHILQMDKLFSQDDIDYMSGLLGYSVLEYKGSYGCRHRWVRFRGKEWSGVGSIPTDFQIERLVKDQERAGLLE
jgi:hypothetical protein